jgi:hypothetical protein
MQGSHGARLPHTTHRADARMQSPICDFSFVLIRTGIMIADSSAQARCDRIARSASESTGLVAGGHESENRRIKLTYPRTGYGSQLPRRIHLASPIL